MENSHAVEAGANLIIGLLAIGVAIVIGVVQCLLLKMNYDAIPEEHRKLSSNQVWLLLIPLFNLYWIFIVFLRLSESYQSYFYSIDRSDVGDCGRGLGLAYCICCVLSVIPCIGSIIALAALVLLIIYLVKAFGLRSQVLSGAGAAAAIDTDESL